MKSSLSDHPLPDGTTSYCDDSFGLVKNVSPMKLQGILNKINKSGEPLGTKHFGRKKKSKKKSKKKRRSFGNYIPPFLEGKLSNSVRTEGLPLGAKSPTTIYDTYPNIYKQGSPLPQPYGQVDNLRMQSLFDIHGFGRKRSNSRKGSRTKYKSKKRGKSMKKMMKKYIKKYIKKSKRKSKKMKKMVISKLKKSKRTKRKSKRGFGNSTTPGTPQWKHSASQKNIVSNYMNKYANQGALKKATGWTNPSSLYIGESGTTPNLIGMVNEPGQYSNNQLNSPVLLNFGNKKPKGSKTKRRRPSLTKKRKSKKSFGPLVPNVAGPNVVGYESSMPIYHGGANTIDFATNKLFRPDIIKSVGKVQPDGMTPAAWLTRSKGLGNNFGDLVYTADSMTYGSGHNTIMQPKPSYLKYGKKRSKKSFGSMITLEKNGKIHKE